MIFCADYVQVQNMFKVFADGNPKQVEMTQDVLDMAIAISNYVQENPMESDFFLHPPRH